MNLESRLAQVLAGFDRLAVAVSGGVDSMTLADCLNRAAPGAMAVHAVSPAVPPDATARVRRVAAQQGWRLEVVGAGEFDDPDYLSNPVHRCYICKSHLYDRIREVTSAPIASGANVDDLADYRPGLLAAEEHSVVHPLIRAGFGKAEVRALAREIGLTDIAELPAQPCLASRIATGLPIDPDELSLVDRVESRVRSELPSGVSVRCRITRAGAHLELDEEAMVRSDGAARVAAQLCTEAGLAFGGVRPYRMGAMFHR